MLRKQSRKKDRSWRAARWDSVSRVEGQRVCASVDVSVDFAFLTLEVILDLREGLLLSFGGEEDGLVVLLLSLLRGGDADLITVVGWNIVFCGRAPAGGKKKAEVDIFF